MEQPNGSFSQGLKTLQQHAAMFATADRNQAVWEAVAANLLSLIQDVTGDNDVRVKMDAENISNMADAIQQGRRLVTTLESEDSLIIQLNNQEDKHE